MKSKLGISIGFLGAAVYFLGLAGGYIPIVILAGYILLFESDRWLKVSAIKAVAVCLFFSLISICIGFIPNIITLIDNICRIFGENFSLDIATKIVNLLNTLIAISQKVILLALGFNALNQKSFGFNAVDKLINVHFPLGENTSVSKSSNTKKCPKCGEEIPAESSFCGGCGNKI